MRNLIVSVFAFAVGVTPLAVFGQTETAPAPAAAPEQTTPVPTAPAPAVPASAAAAAPATPASPAAPVVAPPIAFTWEALVDAYYMYNFTGNPSTQGPGAPRQFDVAANSFSLNYAKLGVGADTEYVAFRMDLGAGHTAAIINKASALMSPPDPNTPAGALSNRQYGNDFLVQQAFATIKPTKWLSVDAGRFVTTASAEVIESNKNWLYSRSMLFYGVPLLHTGLRANVTVNPSLKLQASLVNGWNNDPDNNIGKTFGANATFAPPDSGLNASLTTYIGKEGAVSGGDTTVLLDGVFTKDIANASVGLNIDYYKLGTPYWIGAAAMGKYAFTDMFNVAARFEVVSSKQGAYTSGFPAPTSTPPAPPPANPALGDVVFYEGTLMGGLIVAKHFELRLELRADFADQNVFQKGDAGEVASNRKNQFTGLLAFLAYF